MKRFSLLSFLLAALVAMNAAQASAQTCIEDVFDANANGTLTCSAGDIASVTATVLNGVTECDLGDNVALELELDIAMNTNERFDFGIYTATDGGDAMTGDCAINVAPNAAPFADVDGDDCGDVNSNMLNDFELAPINVPCIDEDGNGFLDFPSCFSWRVPGSNEVCSSAADVYPNPGSKCDCVSVQIDAIAVPGSIDVTKTANPDTLAMPGGVVTFTVEVMNNSGNGVDVTIDTLNDSVFGDISDNMNPSILSTTCSLNQTISDGNSYSCEFTANISSNHTDTVTASGTDSNGNPVSDMDDAEVVIVNCLMDSDCNDMDPCTVDTCIAEPMSCGDADSNGGVSASDALNILRAATGLSSECTIARCDVDASGAITASDALRVLRNSIGIASVMACAPQCDNAPMVCQDDGMFCNGDEVCVAGTCESEGDPCAGNARCTDVCEEDTDMCGAGNVPATDETCDGLDDDCDGGVDEDFMPMPTMCGVGECGADGMTQCIAGVVSDTCMPGAPGSDANCNGLDDDCDGLIDEDYVPQPTQCGIGECAADGMTQCVNGMVSDTCMPGMPGSDANCDGLDNDCDGGVDEDFAPQPTMCGVGECGADGMTQCIAGVVSDTCMPGAPGSDANCDGRDNDCDGGVDEDFVPQPTMCGTGQCAANGMTQCTNGMESDTCTPGAPGSDANCDGLDNDCDGGVDEDFMPQPTMCGEGECGADGMTQCIAGVESDTCTPGAPGSDANCNGMDDDCDGQIDEDFSPQPTMCGEGECAADGMTQCIAGVESDTCTPGAPGSDANCNGMDDDCDGMVDEDFVPQPTMCGVGECAADGMTQCIAGVESDTCTPGAPDNGDMCDGLDNDCDGQIDENFIPQQTNCGTGECAADGVTACTNGQVVDSCEAGMPGMGDMCDGLDNDCDGQVDEDFMPQPTECGAGSCSMAGMTQCVNGMIGDTCMEGDPISNTDETCDGVDDDCDGMIDDDFMPQPTDCGVGVCAGTGETTCEMGQIGDTCVPGNPISNMDETCDDIDDDCDGTNDEDFVPQPTMCGAGECAADGMTQCEAGMETDTCEAGMPGDGDLCDGLDNDCDGMIDEDHQVVDCAMGECRSGQLICDNGATTCTLSVEMPGTPCNDYEACTENDQCDGNGNCTGTPVETQDVLDFEDHLEGAIVSMTSGQNGTGPVGVLGFNPNLGAAINASVIFDSSCIGGCTGGDIDLGTPNEEFGGPGIGAGGGAASSSPNDVPQGNVLIIATNVNDVDMNMLVDNPNDQSFTVVTHRLDFIEIGPIVAHELVLIDIEPDEAPGVVDLYDGMGALITSIPLPDTSGNNGRMVVDLGDVEGVRTMDVTLNGSGAIDDVAYTTGQCEEQMPN